VQGMRGLLPVVRLRGLAVCSARSAAKEGTVCGRLVCQLSAAGVSTCRRGPVV